MNVEVQGTQASNVNVSSGFEAWEGSCTACRLRRDEVRLESNPGVGVHSVSLLLFIVAKTSRLQNSSNWRGLSRVFLKATGQQELTLTHSDRETDRESPKVRLVVSCSPIDYIELK